ncbi:ABC transporter permease [Mobiluncus mulieris]|uniref:ABC transporter permease n=1 Tax=Mobiluncus mulieris TaxID=2052 RepID=UPI00200B1F94|nr:ABC transporter permease subunit [Mobiluncus mulieris]
MSMSSDVSALPLSPWLRLWTWVSVVLGLLTTSIPLLFMATKIFSMSGFSALKAIALSASGHRLIINTIALALMVAVIGTFLGATTALAITVLPLPGKIWWHRGLLFPSLLGPFIIPVILIVSIGRSGILFSGFFLFGFDLYGFWGISLCQIISLTPTAYLITLSALRTINPQLLTGVATLGVSNFQIMRSMVFPVVRQPIRQAFMILMVESAADLATPLVLGGKYRVLTAALYSQAVSANSLETASVYALILATFSLGIILLTRSFTPPLAAFYSSGWFSNQTWRSCLTPVEPLALVLIGIAVGQSLIGWVVTAALGAMILHTTWLWLHQPITGTISAVSLVAPLSNSFLLATIAVPLIAFLALGISLARPQKCVPRIFYGITRLSLQLPSSVLTFALLCAFARPWRWGDYQLMPTLVGGTSWGQGAIAIVIAYTLRCLNLAINIIEIDLRRINPLWWEITSTLGIRQDRQQNEILVPNLKVSIIKATGLSFLTVLSSLSTVAFLPSTSWEVLTMSMLAQMDGANYGHLFLSSAILFLITAGSQVLSAHFRRRQHRAIGAVAIPGGTS